MLQKGKKIKKVIKVLPLFIIVVITSYFVYSYKDNQNIYKDTTKIMNTISQILDLNTVKYNYSNVITVKKNKSINEIKIPFTEKSYIIKYNGIINGGVKPEDLKITKNTGTEINIEINQCKILDHYIDSENVYVYDSKSSIFNKLEIQEVLDDIDKYKKEYEEKAIEEGLLDEISENTKKSIENMLINLGYKEIAVTVKE